MNNIMDNNTNVKIINFNDLKSDNCRVHELREFYLKHFGAQPIFFVKIPGRVNIIGEHVDYCGFPVLPMALDQCIILAVGFSKDNSNLRLKNLETNKFMDYECDLKEISIELKNSDGPKWHKYFLCGIKGIYETLGNDVNHIGMNVALVGNIPPASGLSSSSALVSAAALATAHVHSMELKRKNLAAISANCERYIGTQGGGMDQAIAYLAEEGCAQFIEFHPELNATPIRLPDGACFVVANSLAEINKAATSDFNERVVECRLASRIIAKRMELQKWRNITRFADLQMRLNCTLEEFECLIRKFLPNESYTRADICNELEISREEFKEKFLTPNTMHMEKFKLRQRALHVIQESQRVRKFRAVCEELSQNNNGRNGGGGDRNDRIETELQTLSQLMRQSHQSLQELYECSHPDLDRLVALSDGVNVGARLTGAGWGGCIVALCDSIETSKKYIHMLKQEYFSKLPDHIQQPYQSNDFNDVIFLTFPRCGAEILVDIVE